MQKKEFYHFILPIFLAFLFSGNTMAQNDSLTYEAVKKSKDLSKKEKKELIKELDKAYLEGRRWRISTSFIGASMDSKIGFAEKGGTVEVELSLEKFLGFESNLLIPKLDLQYSFNRKSSLYFEYYGIFRAASIDPDEDFDWGDIEIPEDAGIVDLFLDTQIWSLGYMYSFINKSHAELSFFANVFILGVHTGIDVESINVHESFRITAPLPSFGYRFSYEILPKLRFGGTHSYFFLSIGDYSGSIVNMKVNLDYRVAKWFSAGLSYSKFDLEIQSKANNFKGMIQYSYEGPGLFLQFIF